MLFQVKSRVRTCDSYSDYFDIAVGLKQGDFLSPVLFPIFVHVLELHLDEIPLS